MSILIDSIEDVVKFCFVVGCIVRKCLFRISCMIDVEERMIVFKNMWLVLNECFFVVWFIVK